jgi:hypothetical protein
MAAKEFFKTVIDTIAETTLILLPTVIIIPLLFCSAVIFICLLVYIISQNAYISNTHQTYGFRPCKERIVQTITDPVRQNVSDLVFDKTCKFYKHLPNEFLIEDEPIITQGTIIATVIFGFIMVWFSVVVCSGKSR